MADPETIRARLRAKVVVDLAGCWIWQGATDPAGYGAIKVDGRKVNAHRLAYKVFVRPVFGHEVVCHECHNPACINPDHLYAGTRAQNLNDALRAGKRVAYTLPPDTVRAIRRARGPREKVAAKYKVAVSTVNKIKGRRLHADTP